MSEISVPAAAAGDGAFELDCGGRRYRMLLPDAASDYIQKKIVAERQPYELEMLEDMRSRTAPGDLVLDVGANIGNHTLYLAAVAGCRVMAFEPNPALCDALRSSLSLNPALPEVTVHACGLGRDVGSAAFTDGRTDNLGARRLKPGIGTIPLQTLDAMAPPTPVRVIKIDVEGMELDVLAGAARTIRRDRPLLYVECITERDFREVSRVLDGHDYCYWATFNATPTHLFVAAESVSIEQRIGRLQYKAAQDQYRHAQVLREIRLRLAQAQDLEKQARAAADASARALEQGRADFARAQAQLERERAESQRLARHFEAAAEELGAKIAARERENAERQAALVRESAERQAALERASAERQAALEREKVQVERRLEVREARLSATERRAAALAERNERIVTSTSHRVGKALVDAARSPRALVGLPGSVWRIYRDGALRRAQRRAVAQGPAAEPAHGRGAAPAAVPAVPPAAARAAPAAIALPADLRELKVACVMDEFTFHSFAPECRLLALHTDRWQEEVAGFAPDLVFIESAWRGADEQWTQKVSNPSPEIMGLIAWCVANGVPSVFWNKEDPAHFGGFLHIARAVDHVFTTDIDCIARYKHELGHDRVYLLPFAAQPALHNPIERFERQDAFCFAGSYYLKYPERQRDFRSLMEVVGTLRPVEIYDRNFHKPHPHYEFPPEYERLIVGSLPFDQIDKAYKGYRFGINMNTVKQSQTMFARRVFELLACNTVVVSNFSRAVRLLFGDLVVCSDAPSELERRLRALCADEHRLRRLRLAGVRKVLAEHTYAHRLAHVAARLAQRPLQVPQVGITVLAWPSDAAEAQRLLAMFRAQRHRHRRLCLVCAHPVETADADQVQVLAAGDAEGLRRAIHGLPWVALWSAKDHYGVHYLTDLALATRYAGTASAIGKAAYYRAAADGPAALQHDGAQYRPAPRLDARCSMARPKRLGDWLASGAPDPEGLRLEADDQLAIDEFNYCRDARGRGDVADAVGDDPELWPGLDLEQDVLPLAQAIRPALAAGEARGGEELPGRSAAELAAELPHATPAGVKLRLVDGALEVRSELAADKHVYLYLRERYPRAALNLELNSRFQLRLDDAADSLDLRTVFEFLDEDGRKLSHAIMKAGAAYSMAIPSRCRQVRFGLRVQGGGTARILRLVLSDVRERPSSLLARAHHLVVAKQYPAYDDLYRYGFVHSRVRGYRRRGLAVDVFRLSEEEPCVFREFDGVDVIQGDRDMLDLTLRSGQYRHVLVHLLDEQMWETLARHIDRVKVTVWVHGAEIQAWHRRAFEFDRFDEAETTRRKALAELRAAFWRRILAPAHPNLSLVFVSRYLADEAQQDLGLELSRVPHAVIHNYVDGGLFAYRPKSAEQRLRLLSIRPFSSRAYANDLTVQAILELAKRPRFSEFVVRLVGDGELFEETTRPLAGLANVTVERRFLAQAEIAALHRDYGVFVCPTRMDTQGVSRDEAMASGLVPVTTRVAAVPEFVDDGCAILVEADNARGLADAIESLRDDPDRFLALSAAAARRVRAQSGFDATIEREIALLEGASGASLRDAAPGGDPAHGAGPPDRAAA